ncbi:hypothetical protein CALVIDRAFT_262869 [Calocera viscosa TUFC12733]|uniref:Uncharacterized protein n=1 Tax=Calocera viscosa (strain TUFC12733) TaxID=1330018 RepID=A0A167J3I2_CALVF|nr:hypothetical protein CALVIDRAFT_262869 [Calocera viscosa TUFC12733]
MLAVKEIESLPSFPQLMESLGHPDEPAAAAPPAISLAWRTPPAVIDEDATSDSRSTTSSRSARTSPVIPSRPSSQLDGPTRKSRSPSGSASKENAGRHRFAPYQSRGAGVPSINIDKANKAAEKQALPTPPISQSLRRANRPQPLALAPRSNNPDIAPAPISALLRAHIRSSAAESGLAPHTASPRISGHAPYAPRSPRHPMTPVSIPTLPPNLPITRPFLPLVHTGTPSFLSLHLSVSHHLRTSDIPLYLSYLLRPPLLSFRTRLHTPDQTEPPWQPRAAFLSLLTLTLLGLLYTGDRSIMFP